jgi:hypothetical protein
MSLENDTLEKNMVGETLVNDTIGKVVVKVEQIANHYFHAPDYDSQSSDTIDSFSIGTETLEEIIDSFENSVSDSSGAVHNQIFDASIFVETFSLNPPPPVSSFMTENFLTANGHFIGRFMTGRINKSKTTFDIMYQNGHKQTVRFDYKVKYQNSRVSLNLDPIIMDYFRTHLVNEDYSDLYN